MAPSKSRPKAVIIGGGPAGLSFGYELAKRTPYQPIILEQSSYLGGIARTVTYKGNRVDIGGHRFFSKVDRVMAWWLNFFPLQKLDHPLATLTYHRQAKILKGPEEGPDPETTEKVMLLRPRKSRIYYQRNFYDYPLKLTFQALKQLGWGKTLRIGGTYLKRRLYPIKPEDSLEAFFINRFGEELYQTFFQHYTEKVWGVSCKEISAAWGAQRVKGLSLTKALWHALKQLIKPERSIEQKGTETSLIEQFLYPKRGPGQLWEYVGECIQALGGEIHRQWQAQKLHMEGYKVVAVEGVHLPTGKKRLFHGELFANTMPIKELIPRLTCPVPPEVAQVAQELQYRDFMVVALLVKRLKVAEADGSLIKDNWIYIQDPDVSIGRLQIFNNWSPYLVAEPQKVWLGAEYFCNQGDTLWQKSDQALIALAIKELATLGLVDSEDFIDGIVLRMPYTYPAYWGAYQDFDIVRAFLDTLPNLYTLGRNGMHRYNNQDHSMMTAFLAVDNIVEGRTDRENIWSVNTEMEYHEEKKN